MLRNARRVVVPVGALMWTRRPGRYVRAVTIEAAPSLVWTVAADPGALAAYETVTFDALLRDVVAPARRTALARSSLANPAQAWLDRVRRLDALAVLGVRLDTLEELEILHGYVLEPAWRAGTPLLVECPQRLTQLDPAAFADLAFRHPYTLERALHAAHRLWRPEPENDAGAPSPSAPLDVEQVRAVAARGGAVQVIAPAGSGKTRCSSSASASCCAAASGLTDPRDHVQPRRGHRAQGAPRRRGRRRGAGPDVPQPRPRAAARRGPRALEVRLASMNQYKTPVRARGT